MCFGPEFRGNCVRYMCMKLFPVTARHLVDAGYSLTAQAVAGMSVQTPQIVPKIATPRICSQARVWGPHHRVSTPPGHHERFRVGSTAESGLRICHIFL